MASPACHPYKYFTIYLPHTQQWHVPFSSLKVAVWNLRGTHLYTAIPPVRVNPAIRAHVTTASTEAITWPEHCLYLTCLSAASRDLFDTWRSRYEWWCVPTSGRRSVTLKEVLKMQPVVPSRGEKDQNGRECVCIHFRGKELYPHQQSVGKIKLGLVASCRSSWTTRRGPSGRKGWRLSGGGKTELNRKDQGGRQKLFLSVFGWEARNTLKKVTEPSRS